MIWTNKKMIKNGIKNTQNRERFGPGKCNRKFIRRLFSKWNKNLDWNIFPDFLAILEQKIEKKLSENRHEEENVYIFVR